MWEKLFFYWLHSTPMWSVVVLQCSHLWYSDSQSRCCICSQWTKGQYAFSVCLVVHPVCTAQILLNMNTGLSGISINILMQAPHCQWAEPPEFNWCIVISPSTEVQSWEYTDLLAQLDSHDGNRLNISDKSLFQLLFIVFLGSKKTPVTTLLFVPLCFFLICSIVGWLSCIALQALFLLCLFSISLPQSLFIVPFAPLVKHFVRNLLFKRRYE